jgi:thiosulfate/3-mercaptopyruvate sulfurtransferase
MNLLVSTAWLADHVDDPTVRIVDTRWYLLDVMKGERGYYEGHIPNAVYLSVDRHLAAQPFADAKTGRHPLPSAQEFAESMAQAGISDKTLVVAYDDAGGVNAARVWWLLRYFGHENAALVDGGWQQWLAEGRAVSTETPAFPRAEFHAQPNPGMVVTKAQMIALTRDPRALILDTRAPERYEGKVEPIDARAGHIPGAKSAPGAGNLQGGSDMRFRNAEELQVRFDALGANGADEIVAYCGSGVNATQNLFALFLAGYKDAKLYTGSFSEWSRDPELPVITGPEPY